MAIQKDSLLYMEDIIDKVGPKMYSFIDFFYNYY